MKISARANSPITRLALKDRAGIASINPDKFILNLARVLGPVRFKSLSLKFSRSLAASLMNLLGLFGGLGLIQPFH